MRRRTALLSLLAAIPLSAGVALADCGERRGGHWRSGGGFEHHLDELGLEPKQKEKIDAILAAARKEREANGTKMREAYQDLHALLEKDAPDRAAIDRQVEKIGAMRTEERKSMLHTLLAVRAELTPEQRTKLKAMKEKEGPWHHGGRHHGPGGGSPEEDGSPGDEE